MNRRNLDQMLASTERLAAVNRCSQLWGYGLFGRQVARVAIFLSGDESWSALDSKAAVSRLFRSRALTPDTLLAACQEANPRGDWEAAELAVAFAACLFPQRSYQLMEPDEIRERLQRFLDAVQISATVPAPVDDAAWPAVLRFPALTERACDATQASSFLDDLTGATLASHKEAHRQEQLDRRSGAGLHLMTCLAPTVERMLARHADNCALLRFLRQSLPSLPSWLADCRPQRGWPDWSAVEGRLAKLFPSESEQALRGAVKLEKMVWYEASRWLRPTLVPQRGAEFWERAWATLMAGFPYYSFRSALATWWQQCLTRHRFSAGRSPVEPLEQVQNKPPIEQEPELPSLVELRTYRELYRVVRTTFFPKAAADPARDHERHRRVLDALWQRRLERQIASDLPKSLMRELEAEFPHVSAAKFNMFSHHLRLRMWAASLARLKRLTNAAIRSSSRPAALRHVGGTSPYPLQEEPALENLITLVKTAAPGDMLLGALTSQMGHGPRVEKRWADPWSFPRYLGELWSWSGAAERIDEMSADSPWGIATRQIVATPAWKMFLEELRQTPDVEAVDRLIAAGNWDGLLHIARAALDRSLGWQELNSFTEPRVKTWRKLAKTNWFVPVWHLTVVERLPPEEILERLAVGSHEVESVLRLQAEMEKSCLRPSNSSS